MAPGASAGRLREACREVEAVFLSVLLQQMWQTAPRDPLLPSGAAGGLFRSLWVEEVGRAAAASGPVGIGDALYEAARRELGERRAG
jgi:flagellar protein FlgJ